MTSSPELMLLQLFDYPQTQVVIAIAPEIMNNFKMRKIPVYTINLSVNSLLMGGLS